MEKYLAPRESLWNQQVAKYLAPLDKYLAPGGRGGR